MLQFLGRKLGNLYNYQNKANCNKLIISQSAQTHVRDLVNWVLFPLRLPRWCFQFRHIIVSFIKAMQQHPSKHPSPKIQSLKSRSVLIHCTALQFERDGANPSSSVMSYIYLLTYTHNLVSVRTQEKIFEKILIGHAAQPFAHQLLRSFFCSGCFVYNNLLQNKCSSK